MHPCGWGDMQRRGASLEGRILLLQDGSFLQEKVRVHQGLRRCARNRRAALRLLQVDLCWWGLHSLFWDATGQTGTAAGCEHDVSESVSAAPGRKDAGYVVVWGAM